MSNDPSDGFKSWSNAQLLEQVEQCLWQCLADDKHSRAMLEAIKKELEERAQGALFQALSDRVAESVLAGLERTAGSPEFKPSPRLQALLQIIVGHTLSEGGPIKQTTLEIAFYGEEEAAHKGQGAIATEVSRLRETLTEYYQGSGLGDPLRIRIPKGKYVALIMRTVVREIPSAPGLETPARPTEIHTVPLNALRGLSAFPAFSPDGNQVAFCWNRDDGGYMLDVFVQSIGASTPRQITSSLAADLSPAWSPDGTELAFVRVSTGRSEIWATAADGSRSERKVVAVFPARHELLGRQLTWSLDGEFLAVADKPASDQPFAIHCIPLSGGAPTPLTHPPAGIVGDSDPTFAPDGSRALAFVRAEATSVKDLFALAHGSEQPVRLTFDRSHIYGLCWLPNSGGLVFSSSRAGTPELWKVGLSGGEPERVTGIADRALHPACSADGRRLAYTNLAVSTSLWELVLADTASPDQSSRRFIHSTRNDVNADFSPDGSQIAFASDRSGAFEIWVCDADGSNLVKVTSFNSPAGAGTPRWSPDGERIAFDCRASGNAQIYVVTLPDGTPQRLTQGPSENVVPAWSKDGRSLYFSSNRTGRHEIWRLPLNGGDAEQWTHAGGFAAIESPAGDYVYYARGRTAPGVWRMSIAKREEESVLDALRPGFWGLWTLTANGIYFLDSDSGDPPSFALKYYELPTGLSRTLAILRDMKRVHYQGLALSAGGQRLLYPQLEESAGEIMLASISVQK